MLSTETRDFCVSQLRTIKRALATQTRWLDACAAFRAGTGPEPAVKTMPSKAAKARMYGHVNWVIRTMGEGWERPTTLQGIAEVIRLAETVLRAQGAVIR